jgi:hypothetical protein
VLSPTTTVMMNMSNVSCQFFTAKDMNCIDGVCSVGDYWLTTIVDLSLR